MVAENPLSNGDDRGPSLPPEPPDSTDSIATSTAEFMITAKALLATIKENTRNQQINYEYDVGKTSTTKQARHPPAMAKINPTPISEPSNHIRVNPTRAEPSTLPAGTPPPISPLENTENTTQYSQDCHGHGSTSTQSLSDPAPLSLNTPPLLPPSQYPDPTYRYTTITGFPVYQCEYTGEYFFQNKFFDGKNYFGGNFHYFIPPPAYNVTPQSHRNWRYLNVDFGYPPQLVFLSPPGLTPSLSDPAPSRGDTISKPPSVSPGPLAPVAAPPSPTFDRKYLLPPPPDLNDPDEDLGPEVVYDGKFTDEDMKISVTTQRYHEHLLRKHNFPLPPTQPTPAPAPTEPAPPTDKIPTEPAPPTDNIPTEPAPPIENIIPTSS